MEKSLIIPVGERPKGRSDPLTLLKQAVAMAANNYRAEVNLPNTTDGWKTATEIVAAAVAANLLSDEPDFGRRLDPRETGGRIEAKVMDLVTDEKGAVDLVQESLNLRRSLRSGTQTAVSELTGLPFPGARRNHAFVLGIDQGEVKGAREILRKFEIIPDVSGLAALISLKKERESVLPPNARAILGRVMPEALPETLERMTPKIFDQAMVARGATAGITGKIVDEPVDWLALPYDKLDRLAGKVAAADLGEPATTAELLAAQLLLLQDIIDPSVSLYTAYLEQFGRLCQTWQRTTAAQTETGIRRFQAMEKVFEGWPLTPNLLAAWCLEQENLEAAVAAARQRKDKLNHLWMNEPIVVEGWALPSPEIVSSLAAALNRGGEARHPAWRRLKQAQDRLAEFEFVVRRTPDKVSGLLERLQSVAPELAEAVKQERPPELGIRQLSPAAAREVLESGRPIIREELDAVLETIRRMNQSRIQVRDLQNVTRKIKAMGKTLDKDARNRAALRDVAAAAKLNDPETLARVAAAAAKRAEIERAELLGKDRVGKDKMARPTWPDFLLSQAMGKKSGQLDGVSEIDQAVSLIEKWRSSLMSQPAGRIFSEDLFGDLNPETVDRYLDLRIKLLPDVSKSSQKRESDRITIARKTFQDGIGQGNVWIRNWVMDELGARLTALVKLRSYYVRIGELDETLELMERLKFGQAGQKDIDGLEAEYEERRRASGMVSTGQRRLMEILPIEVRVNPQAYLPALQKAKELITLREQAGHFGFEIPEKDMLVEILAQEREKFEEKTGKSAVKDGGGDRPSRSQAGRQFIDGLIKANREGNPFIPLDVSIGATLGEMIQAANERIEVAKAAMAIPELEKRRIALEAERQQMRLGQAEIARLARGREITATIMALQEELEAAPKRLLAGMRRLGFAIELEKLQRIMNPRQS